MEHVAIDLGGRESQICIRGGDGGIISEERVATASLGMTLDRPKSRVVMETRAEAFAVADLALGFGHEVRVVPASLVRSLGVGARKTKTDRRGAQVLSEVSCRVGIAYAPRIDRPHPAMIFCVPREPRPHAPLRHGREEPADDRVRWGDVLRRGSGTSRSRRPGLFGGNARERRRENDAPLRRQGRCSVPEHQDAPSKAGG